jgi:ketosteroid isomerase-like protein
MSAELRKANVALVQRWVDAINAPWDFAALEEIFAENVDYGLPWCGDLGFPTQIIGRDETIAFIRQAAEFVEPETIHDVRIHTFYDDPNELLAEYSVATRIIASGAEYANDLLIRVTVRDGKIVRFAEHLDLARLLKSMGGRIEMPQPAETAN